ncbi:Glutaredoxin family protein, partial [Thalictrum thalictroides]
MLEMEIPVMDPPNPFPYAQLSSGSSSPEVSPRFNSKACPSIELSFQEKRSLVEKRSFSSDWDIFMELFSMRDSFSKNCPPGGENSVVLYTTIGWQDRITECNYVRSILKSHQVEIIEREISANSAYWLELRKLLGRTEVPALFVHGRFIGGVNEVKSLEEE